MRVYLLFLTLFFCSISFAQNSISGTVSDSKKQPIPGANIKVVGTNSGAISDFDGKFVLNTSADVLIATYDNVSGIGAASYQVNNFTGTGSQTAFTLSTASLGENFTFVYINGVYQNKNTYAVSGVTLTFSQAPPITSLIEVMFN
mgnify:CR=1 FL=1